jgi:hypothetical protein
MGADIAAVAFVAVIGGGTYWLMRRFLRRRGLKTPAVTDLPPEQRRMFWLFITAAVVITAVCAWAFASGHAAIGIAVLVAFYVLPEFVLLPLRIRRSRRPAEAARARRKGTTAP